MKASEMMRNLEVKEPGWNQQPVLHIDATPDDGYPLRILEAYRENCNMRWVTGSDGKCEDPFYELMNQLQEERAKILDSAIEKIKTKK
jgi:hypothetical protein